MGMIIPPRIPMVIYAVTAQESVGKLFLGGVIPGLLVGVLQSALVYCVSQRRRYPQEKRVFSKKEIVGESLRSLYVLKLHLLWQLARRATEESTFLYPSLPQDDSWAFKTISYGGLIGKLHTLLKPRDAWIVTDIIEPWFDSEED